jgi:hypothetical protein
MYCPKCGRQQISNQVRFCSSCGFQLNAVTDLLVNNGSLPAQQSAASGRLPFMQRKGMRFGAKLMFLSVVMMPLIMAISITLDSPAALFIPVSVFLAGLSWMVYHRIFEHEAKIEGGNQNLIGNPQFNQALPPMQETGEPIYGERRLNTAEKFFQSPKNC